MVKLDPDSMPPTVAIILVSWNTRELLRRALQSIREHAAMPVHVVVVDNASGDGSPKMVRAEFPEATLIVNPDNRGFGQANNQGFAASDAPLILLLNSDAELMPGALPALVDALQRHQGRASFFLTGDFLTNENFDPLLRRMFNENHLLGPHSDKHLLYCSWEKERETLVTQEQFRADVQNNQKKIRHAADRLDERPDLKSLPPLHPHQLEVFRQRYGSRAATNHSPALPQSAAPAGSSNCETTLWHWVFSAPHAIHSLVAPTVGKALTWKYHGPSTAPDCTPIWGRSPTFRERLVEWAGMPEFRIHGGKAERYYVIDPSDQFQFSSRGSARVGSAKRHPQHFGRKPDSGHPVAADACRGNDSRWGGRG